MDPNTAMNRPLWRRIFRIGGPQLIILLTIAFHIAIGSWPGLEDQPQRVAMTQNMALMLGGLALLFWVVFFSGWKKARTVPILAVLLGIAFVTFDVQCDGNTRPRRVRLKEWVQRAIGISHDDELEAYHQQQNATASQVDLTEQPNDWPAYRGKDRTGVIREGPALARDWDKNPPKQLWKQPIGGGYAAFCVVNNHLITIEQRRDEEAVVCYDAKTGQQEWVYRWPSHFKEALGGNGPRATPCVDNGDVFALGATGKLVCIDGKEGSLKWSVETLEQNNNLQWAMSGSPLVVNNLVIVTPGTQTQEAVGKAVIAYDRTNGQKVWSSGQTQGSYSSPMLAYLDGKQQILIFDAEGVAGLESETGKELWRYPWMNNVRVNVGQPIVIGENRLFVGSGYELGGVLLEIKQSNGIWTPTKIWQTASNVMRNKFASSVLYKEHLYGLNDGRMQCVSLKNGKPVWSDDRRQRKGEAYGHGQILLQDDLIIVLTEFGELVLLEATPDTEEPKELGRIPALEADKTWNNPALVDGKLYIRNHRQMACFDLRETKE